MLVRVCRTCGEEKLVDNFYRDFKQCRPCCAAWARKYRQTPQGKQNRQKSDALSHARHRAERIVTAKRKTLSKYGMTYEDWLREKDKTGNKCFICNKEEKAQRNGHTYALFIDHDHSTMKYRGLLCRNCNSLLGHAKDDIETLQKAIEYLKKHEQNGSAN